MKHQSPSPLCVALALAFSASLVPMASSAAVLDLSTPFIGSGLHGDQSDVGSTATVTTAISLPSNSSITSIQWWGYHGAISAGDPTSDSFDIVLGSGPALTGYSLNVDASNAEVVSYVASFASSFASTAATLSIVNTDNDAEWYWRANTLDNLNPGGSYAYTISGSTSSTPVPGPLPVLGALAALGWGRKLRARIRQADVA
jgi:hypothetical protein